MSNDRWHYVEQRSPEWRALRLGRVTASRIADLTAQTKSGWSASRANYAAELVLERITGVIAEQYTNGAMQYGIDTEPQARSAYAFMTNAEITDVGFIEHPAITLAGCSPDGMVGEDGMIEIKCPQPATHLETLLSKTVSERYLKQMQFQLACAERQWCDFVSYRPDFPASMQLFISRIHRDDKLIEALEQQTREFLAEIAATVDKLERQYKEAA